MTSKNKQGTEVDGEQTKMPRPLRRLPALPSADVIRHVRAAAKKHFGMSDRAAGAMSTIWVDPEQVLPQLERPRRMRIPGGDLWYIEGEVWTPRLVPDVNNPRNANEHTYPVAGDAVEGTEVFTMDTQAGVAELTLKVSGRDELTWALDRAMKKTRAKNEPHPKITEQGIMDAPFGVMSTFEFDDGTAAIAVPRVREGSSRVCWAQDTLGHEPDDALFRMPSSAKPIREFIDEINAIVEQPASSISEEDRAKVRCATTNFILIVGFRPDEEGTLDLEDAIKAKVAQEHLNRKADWDTEAGDAVLADDCLAAASRAGLLRGDEEYRWLRGELTRAEAAEAGLEESIEDRFARLIWLFTTQERLVHDAIRRPIAFVLRKDGDRRVQVRRTTKLPYAVELTAREFRGTHQFGDVALERIPKILINGGPVAMLAEWEPTSRTLAALTKAALGDAETGKLGRSSAELAVRALYYAAVYDVLRVPRNDQGANSDRRKVSEVLEAMALDADGIRVLADIVKDGRRGKQPYRRDDDGQAILSGEGVPVSLTNSYIRYELFPKNGTHNDDDSDNVDPFVTAQHTIEQALEDLLGGIALLEAVEDLDGNSIVEEQGLPKVTAKKWRKLARDVVAKFDDWYETGVEYNAPIAHQATKNADDAGGQSLTP
ncbi:hypothetical protein [Labedaea rhizosphaerae]|uniref:Uncharacterized protein n=1 Tax=Labedaea rhizosphaerae TaxID=598644 RepID=A0A4R6SLR0_LABRH|nr:hypothetical protein [Labedaea rhizosphaerae]TDQ04814.1 hypothetical protein EV186_101772 [Labedaea rhizosphaerae]